MNTLLVGEIHPAARELLQKSVALEEVTTEQFLNGHFPGIEAIVLRTYTPLKEKELDKLPALRFVVSCSVGLDNIDVNLLQKRGITLIHCPGSNANSVAEHTIYLLFSLLRKEKPFYELKGKTVGIVGLGFIGKLVARKLKGCECRVIAFDVIEQDKVVLKELQVEMKPFDEVVKADIVTIHVPLNSHTEKLITEKVFAMMKENAFFINTSRAEVIDEDGLLEHQEKFRGIALDVFSERLKGELKGNIILTDHVAAQGEDSFREMCVQPVTLFLEKIKPQSI